MIPHIEYTKREHNTWATVYKALDNVYKTHACKAQREGLRVLVDGGCYKTDRIPQLQDISDFLKGIPIESVHDSRSSFSSHISSNFFEFSVCASQCWTNLL